MVRRKKDPALLVDKMVKTTLFIGLISQVQATGI